MAENTSPLFGKPWTDHSVHNTHPAALAVKESLESDELQVKIRRTSEDQFRVKTRRTLVAEAAKNTKSKSSGPPKTRSARRKEKAAKHKARQEKG